MDSLGSRHGVAAQNLTDKYRHADSVRLHLGASLEINSSRKLKLDTYTVIIEPLHTQTLYLTTVLVTSIMAIVVLAFWRFNRGLPGVTQWGLTAVMGLVMFITVGLRSRLPELVSVLVTNVCIITLPYLGWTGCRAYLCLSRPKWRQDLLIGLGVMAVITFFTVAEPNLQARILVQNLVAGLLYALMAKTIGVGGWQRYPARYTHALTVAAHAVFMLSVRPWLLITANAEPTDNQLVLASWILLESMVFYLLLSISMMLLVIEQLSLKLVAQAEIDPLTRVFNRNAFMTLLNKARSRCERQNLPLSVMMIDLDHFKFINDTWGHQAGDQVLKRFAAMASAALRNEDVIGRMGGEEFCVILTGSHLSEAQEIGERLRHACESETVVAEEIRIRFTISIGIAQVTVSESLETAIRRADQAMYRAKRIGRNRVELAQKTPELMPA